MAKFKKPHKDKLPKGVDVQSLFFLNENKSKCESLKKKNGLSFFSIDEYNVGWKKIDFDCKSSIYSVNKKDNKFKSWDLISNYVEAISDIVLIDAYIFSDSSLYESNLYKIIYNLCSDLTSRINLTIISYSDTRQPLAIENIYNNLRKYFNGKGLSINLSIVLSRQSNKQHDRAILTNYFMISSGDSFNYFSPIGNVRTKGTDIRFESYCNPMIYKMSEVKIKAVQDLISVMEKENDVSAVIMGDYKDNKLLYKKIKE